MARYNPYDGRAKRSTPDVHLVREPAREAKLPDGPACASEDPEIFYPLPTDRKANLLALAVCKMCVIREECLEKALAYPEFYGVWGGTTEIERRRLIVKRMFDRPADSVQ